MKKLLRLIKKKKINTGHNINYIPPIEKKYKKKIYNKIFYIDPLKVVKSIKTLFFFLIKFYKKKRISLFVSTKKQHEIIINKYKKKINFYFLSKWNCGTITNINQISKIKKIPDIIFVFDPVKNFSIVREAIKKQIIIVIFSDSHYPYKNYDFYIPINDDSEKSLDFVLKNIYLLLKKIEIKNYYKHKKNYYFFKNKKKIIRIKMSTDFFLRKKYFNYKIKQVINLASNRKIQLLKKKLKYISNFYNEKIKLIYYIKVNKQNKFYLHSNKILCVANSKNGYAQDIYSFIAFRKLILTRYFYYIKEYKKNNLVLIR